MKFTGRPEDIGCCAGAIIPRTDSAVPAAVDIRLPHKLIACLDRGLNFGRSVLGTLRLSFLKDRRFAGYVPVFVTGWARAGRDKQR